MFFIFNLYILYISINSETFVLVSIILNTNKLKNLSILYINFSQLYYISKNIIKEIKMEILRILYLIRRRYTFNLDKYTHFLNCGIRINKKINKYL